jgi:hypothetical protein
MPFDPYHTLNERESIWEIKGTIGKYRRQTKLRATITEWVKRQKVAFKVDGVNEVVTGIGSVELTPGNNGIQSTILSASIGIEAGGALGPVLNRILLPWVRTVAEELVEKIIEAVNLSTAYRDNPRENS